MSIVLKSCFRDRSAYRQPGSDPFRQERGAVAIIVAVFLLAMIGTAAFAIDVGRWFVVKNELQNAADAAALAGAGHIYPPIATGPNWASATTEGTGAISLNTSEKVVLSDGSVTPGYWDFTNRTFDSTTAKTPGTNDLPALRVTVDRKDGANSGPMLTSFGRIFGTDTMDASATATAVVAVPGQAGEGTLAPFAVSDCMFDIADPPLWNPNATTHPKFVIASGAAGGNHCNGCACGQWTSFQVVDNSASGAKERVEQGNSEVVNAQTGGEINIVDDTYILPGVNASVYDTADEFWTGKDIRVTIVANDSLGSKGFTPVLGFACLHVYRVVKGGSTSCQYYNGEGPLPGGIPGNGNKCAIVSFSTAPACRMPGGGVGGPGPYMGVSLPPRLVQ